MPTLKMNENLTNQELLKELEKRIAAGKINLDIDNRTEEAEPCPSPLISQNVLLFALAGAIVLWFYSQQKSTLPVQLQTIVKINEA